MKKLFYIFLLFFCFQSNYSQDLLAVEVYFTKDWKFLGMGYHDLKKGNDQLVYLPDFTQAKCDLVKYVRQFKMSEKLMNDYFNHKIIYPDCNGSDSGNIVIDKYLKTNLTDLIKNKYSHDDQFTQSVFARPYAMQIDANGKDLIQNNGAVYYFEEDYLKTHTLKSELYCRVFDNGDNIDVITPEYDDNHNITSLYYAYNYDNQTVCYVTVSRGYISFAFWNYIKKEEMHYRVTPAYVTNYLFEKGSKISNNIVYEIPCDYGNPIQKSKSSTQFLIDFFKDYPKMKLRMLKNANKIPNDDKTGLCYEGILKFQRESNLSIEKVLDLLVYESFVGGYSNSKTIPCNFYYSAGNRPEWEHFLLENGGCK